jgi:hypothetical protein
MATAAKRKPQMARMAGNRRWENNPDQYRIAAKFMNGDVPIVCDVEPVPWTGPNLPPEWTEFRREINGFVAERNDKMKVIATCSRELDGKAWLHVSLSYPKRMPSYADMKEIKTMFIGPCAVAYELFPPETELINAHPYCRHLWSPMEGSVTPDFTRGNGTV